MSKIVLPQFFYKYDFDIKWFTKTDCPLNKETKEKKMNRIRDYSLPNFTAIILVYEYFLKVNEKFPIFFADDSSQQSK